MLAERKALLDIRILTFMSGALPVRAERCPATGGRACADALYAVANEDGVAQGPISLCSRKE